MMGRAELAIVLAVLGFVLLLVPWPLAYAGSVILILAAVILSALAYFEHRRAAPEAEPPGVVTIAGGASAIGAFTAILVLFVG